MAKEWTLRELAAESGVPERTIRFYISRGLIDPPLRGGRGAAYGDQHKVGLDQIRRLQAKGLMLAEIAAERAQTRGKFPDGDSNLGSPIMRSAFPAPPTTAAPSPLLPEPAAWRAYAVAPDVIVMHRAESAPWRVKRVLSALARFSEAINLDSNDNKGGPDE